MKFVDRRRELKQLDDFYHHPRAGLLIVYGRRRVGKTSLLSHWLDQIVAQSKLPANTSLFWTATTQGIQYQLRDFSQAVIRLDPRLPAPPAPDYSFPTWDAAFGYLADLAAMHSAKSPFVAVIDEFTYLVQSDPGIVGLLQRVWDHQLSRTPNLRLVLSGSLVGIMEKKVLSAQSPLYGRATSLLRLNPLPFGTLAELFPAWSSAERVALYSVCGGVPSYLALFDGTASFTRGLRAGALAPGSLMFSDAALLLNERLTDPFVYSSVLGSIASGYHIWTEIAKMAGVPETNLGHYLDTLQALGLVERRSPVLAGANTRRGRYHVRDPFLRFYYRFLLPHRTAIERGELARVTETIASDLRAFIGAYVFEELCREWVFYEADRGGLGFLPEEVGSFWAQQRGQSVQLDVVAASRRSKQLLIGEAKWGDKPVAREVLTDLVTRSQRMPQVPEGWQTHYVLFARAGFTDATREAARTLNARLVDLSELEQGLRASAEP
ncbi:MAG: ATP-binding protein [Chloroflexi bacterium]|nr:ATP-binding protein [Chloroflexota bacterium]